MNQLSNVEFMLLQVITECNQASGYDINKLIDQRGYREWANIGTTSIYAGLKKLNDKGLIESEDSGEKFGKGPMPIRFTMTEVGMTTLRNEIIAGLSSSRERDNRFDLGLAAIPLLEKGEAIGALRKRLDFLGDVLINIRQNYESQGGVRLPLYIRALFLHPMSLIESEQAFVANLINELLEEMKEDVNND
ncbi:PadR family transcriptional regulator [Paenibacillus sp. sptzw28]|uniref:PadR family transcriptional regulator n=1 Tax=Paenibacillus sp. sptzw28 TaxID=715179 RepID=UPI001C6DFAFF|nr:PadR family transcriptional regulator [Paenibacillus sp. sptzw28]QYR21607.1 PadR family transcriptional regulator [Paenibacillus sp. sptzw28]